VLQGKGIIPHRSLEQDSKLTDQAMSYDSSAARRATVTMPASTTDRQSPGAEPKESVAPHPEQGIAVWDFARMTSAQRLAYDQQRLRQKFG
jgi:hypothetical protein